jgi:hypothetical protein
MLWFFIYSRVRSHGAYEEEHIHKIAVLSRICRLYSEVLPIPQLRTRQEKGFTLPCFCFIVIT